MIDMNPGDMSCIYSTLKYISNHAHRYQQTAVITFDQPLYWKAMTIVSSENDRNTLSGALIRLGGFHCVMSYLGCIGQLMSGSGLKELLETVYASNTVPHMLSGKAVSRALRGHFLAGNAICSLLMRQCEGDGMKESESNENERDDETNRKADAPKNELVGLYEKLTSGDIDLESLYSNDCLADKYLAYQSKCRNLSQYPTSALWIQYLEMIDILRTFITAEHTGNWDLGLKSLRDMLPFFAAAGHNLYLRSVYLYLQCMQNLPVSHPEVYASFNPFPNDKF